MFKEFTRIHFLIIALILFGLFKSNEYFTIPSSGLNNTLRQDIKKAVFGDTRYSGKFNNFLFRTNKDKCNILGSNDCNTNEYCTYGTTCNIKSADDILTIFNDKINAEDVFKLSGY